MNGENGWVNPTVMVTDKSWRDQKLWGAKAIADFAEVSVDTVYRWEQLPDCPVSKPGGRYFALRTALSRWMLSKAARSCENVPDISRSCGVDRSGGSAA